ncbi:VCBS repeat-containing protein [Flavobacterium sp. GN10]|uniref:VCBS repeat-containing protein n=1 Tax=Flavobacterium tagetis TaxID=2801336 RepID=A0ABS1KAP3_9FLAO|nr:RHS repeat-associated core domain-containing protein [Flavobacterium tagetis]MBL0736399.1 VCBS repeat-containing protein [Flavobacterium tagetis]
MKKFYISLLFLFVGLFGFGQSTEVGVTEGELSVSLLGAATYAIPITVPPGINGVVPQISLTYNSQLGNGMAGYGWNIAGISTVSRIPATKFHDDVIDAVDFNALDRFALDGQRLIVKNGTNGAYGADKTIYETESFSNIKITSFGVHPLGANYGPAYFLVEYPDGSKAYYGYSADSRSVTDWAITYWENPQGVRISYNYSASENSFNNVLNIISIKYGSIATTTPINEIKFKYDTRKRAEQSYIGGLSIVRNTILKEINVVGNGVGFRNYILEQEETSLGYQRLKALTEKSGDSSKSYNPTTFTYETTISDVPLVIAQPATLGISGIDYTNTDYISGDFDNDGKTDVLLFSKTEGLKNKFTLFSHITAGAFNSGKTENVDTFDNIFTASFLSSDNKLLPQGWLTLKKTDTNCSISLYGSGSTSSTSKHYEKQYNFSKTVAKESNWSYCDPKDYKGLVLENIPIEYVSGDFDGDGLTDVIAIEKSFYYTTRVCNFGNHTTEYPQTFYQGGKSYLFNLDRRLNSNEPENIGNIVINSVGNSKIFVADFDGDGKSDIYVFEPSYIRVHTLTKDKKLVLLHQNDIADASLDLKRQILFGDFNGDGKMDFVIPQKDNVDSWTFYFSTGTRFNKVNTSIGLPYYTSYMGYFGVVGFPTTTYSLNENTFVANDFNGDGKTDILYQQNFTVEYVMTGSGADYSRKGESQITKLVLLENLSCTGSAISFNLINKSSQLAGVKRSSIPIFTNHNKINQNLEYSLISDNKIISFNSPKDNREDVLLKGITNGNQVKETITYKPLKQDPYEPFYTPSALAETFPNTDVVISQGFKMVSMLEKQSKEVSKKQRYFYAEAVLNIEGLGFLGFRSTSKTNWYQNDSQIISTVSKFDTNLRGANVENYTVLGLHSPLRYNPNAISIPNTIVKENGYNVAGVESLTATQSIILKPNTWIKPGSTFSAKINEDACSGTSINTPSNFVTKSLLTYESELQSNKVFKIKNSKTKQFNGLENTSTETTIDYDSYNNVVKSVTLLKESGITVQTTVSNIGYEAPVSSLYVIGRPSSKNQSVSVSGDVMTSEELYSYQNSLLTQIKKKGTNTDYIVEDNIYDAFGNVTKKTITVAGLVPRITSYEYDTSGRFLTVSKDIEGLSTAYEYNLSNGVLKNETNPFGLKTSYDYDSWFKKTTTTDYLGKTSSCTYTKNNEQTIISIIADDGSASEETFDSLGRKTKSGIKDINGSFSFISYEYDIYDRNFKVSEPYFGISPTQWNQTNFDEYGRTIQNQSFTGKVTNITYSGLATTISDGIKSKTSVKNAMGNIVSMTDSPGGTITYAYFANGNLKSSNYNGVNTTIEQDGWGRKTKLVDASAGTYTYGYNGFGETISETTPNGTTVYVLDEVGRIKQKTISGTSTNSKTTYAYDSSSKLLLNSKFEDLSNGTNVIINDYTYDNYKRVSNSVETTPFASFTKTVSYDAFGRVELETSTAVAGGKSSSKTVKNVYKNGSHWQILDNATSAILWQVNTVNARGQLRTAQSGPLAITRDYNIYGLTTLFKYDRISNSANILTLNTVFDAKRGNLTSRTNSLFGQNENFKYDAQDRLTEFTNVKGEQEKQLYDDQGRITQNNLGTYSYTITGKPYQNNSIEVTPEVLEYYAARPIQNISYNTFKSPVQIEEAGIDKISFNYNDSNSRTAMFYGGLQDDKLQRPMRKYYAADGTMEIKHNIATGVFEFITYIGGDGYSAPIVVKGDGNVQNLLYLQRDYQGSILSITDGNGAILEKRLFDAWGAIVSVQDGAGNNLAGLTILDRGYTGHEHLQSVGLINMNGRIYDPKLHRFLQPDNFVQDPSNTQNFNRYGYCWNNPLVYTDPSGEIVPLVVAAIIVVSAAVNVYQNWGKITGGTGKFSDINWGKFVAYTGTGAVAGALTVYGGPYGVIWAGGFQNFSNSVINGDNFRTTLENTGSGIAAGGLTLGFGQGLGLAFPNGIFSFGNPILKEGVNNTFGTVLSSFLTTSILAGDFNEGFKTAFNPVNIGSALILGGLEGARQIPNNTKVPVEAIRQNQPLLESLQLNSIPLRTLPQNVVIPPAPVFIPQRTVIPQKYNYNISQNKYKG